MPGRDPFQVTSGGGSGEYEPVPAGQHFAGLAAALFLPNRPGWQGGPPVNEIQMIWVVPAIVDVKGQPKQVRNYEKWPDNPLDGKANFAKFLRTWTGGDRLTAEQKAQFNLRQIIGGRCLITTEIATSKSDRQFAKLISPAPVPPDAPPIDYTGVVIRVPPYPDMVTIAAPGVRIEIHQQRQQAAPPPAAAAVAPAQPVYAPAAAAAAPHPSAAHPGGTGAPMPPDDADIPLLGGNQ